MSEPSDSNPLRAVLTGDVTHSTGLPKGMRANLPGVLRNISTSALANFAGSIHHPVDVFRGDSWQLLVDDPSLSLRIALFVRANLRASFEDARVDTRIAIGVGTVDFVPENGVSGGDGEAFRLSGQALDEMGRGFRMAFVLSERLPHALSTTLDAIIKLIDVQASAWTQRQAFAISKALLGWTQEEIGKTWMDSVLSQRTASQQTVAQHAVSQQTVAQHLASAGWNAIEHALSVMESVLPAQ